MFLRTLCLSLVFSVSAHAAVTRFNPEQINCSDDHGLKKLCPDALWKKIEANGLKSLSGDDQHFVKRIDRLKRADPLALKSGDLNRYEDLEDRVREAGLGKLSELEREAWQHWNTPTARGQN